MTAPDDRVELPDLAAMIDLLRNAGWRHARLAMAGFELELSDDPPDTGAGTPPPPDSPPAPAPAPSPPPASAVPDDGTAVVVRARSIGVFWRSPQPGAPPFAEVGDSVEADTPLAIVEVMKMMTRVEPGVRGVVTAIHVENGDVVEFDQPLVTITPA